jgi:hypothetical protein
MTDKPSTAKFHHSDQLRTKAKAFEMLHGAGFKIMVTEGLPVTCDGKVVGKVLSVIHDEVSIEIFKEHAAYVQSKLDAERLSCSIGTTLTSKDNTPSSPPTPSSPFPGT